MVARSLLTVLLLMAAVPAHASDFNILNLDNATMKLLIGKDLPAFVRFDKEYGYGEKADAFKALAAAAVGSDLIIGTVGISTYGEKQNQDLAELYGYKKAGKDLEYADMDKDFPKFRFFPANGGKDIDYTGAVTADAMTLFLKNEAKVYFGLKGTLRNFDALAAEFVKSSDKAAVLTRTKEAAATAKETDAAAYYVRVMEKITEKGADWAQKENDRLNQMLNGGKMAEAKKADMQLKMNRLSAFISPNDEL